MFTDKHTKEDANFIRWKKKYKTRFILIEQTVNE